MQVLAAALEAAGSNLSTLVSGLTQLPATPAPGDPFLDSAPMGTRAHTEIYTYANKNDSFCNTLLAHLLLI